jgi:hypothetical protein
MGAQESFFISNDWLEGAWNEPTRVGEDTFTVGDVVRTYTCSDNGVYNKTGQLMNFVTQQVLNPDLDAAPNAPPPALDPQAFDLVMALNDIILRAPRFDKELVVFRGMADYTDNLLAQHFGAGSSLLVRQPLSTALTLQKATEFSTTGHDAAGKYPTMTRCCLMEIHLPPLFPLLSILNLSCHPDEQEVLLPYMLEDSRRWRLEHVSTKFEEQLIQHTQLLGKPWDRIRKKIKTTKTVLMKVYVCRPVVVGYSMAS